MVEGQDDKSNPQAYITFSQHLSLFLGIGFVGGEGLNMYMFEKIPSIMCKTNHFFQNGQRYLFLLKCSGLFAATSYVWI